MACSNYLYVLRIRVFGLLQFRIKFRVYELGPLACPSLEFTSEAMNPLSIWQDFLNGLLGNHKENTTQKKKRERKTVPPVGFCI